MSGSEEEEEEYDEFEQQFRLERLEKERRNRCSTIKHGATRTDEDGTVYEWDADKLAYFPMIDQNFIAQYQMNYGTDPVAEEKKEAERKPEAAKPTGGTTDWSTYFSYVMKYSTEHGKYPPDMAKEHIEYYNYLYNYYYGDPTSKASKAVVDATKPKTAKENTELKEGASVKDGEVSSTEEAQKGNIGKDEKEKEEKIEGPNGEENEGKKGDKDEVKEGEDEKNGGQNGDQKDDQKDVGERKMPVETADEKAYREYYEYYQNYYAGHEGSEADASVDSEQQEFDEWAYYNYYYGNEEGKAEGKVEEEKGEEEEEDDEEEEGDKSKKKKRKLEEKKKEGWFEIEATKNTNVYVSGLPDDITDDEFKELMNKCGMITLDPRGKDYKLKLYRDKDGKPKGDGLCCYMKSESVDLALQMLDEYDVRGHRISVEVAQFEMKGKFDPKKRKKLSNKERKNIKKQQEKLLDWRPNKPVGYRPKHERIIVIKNAFNTKDFEDDPKRIQILREELRAQCVNFGIVKKVIVYDRHEEGLVSVAFDEVSEADMAIESLNGRFFNRRQITAEAWDGKSKFEVKETEAEREARLNQWGVFLEEENEEGKKDGKKAGGTKAKKGKYEKSGGGAGKQRAATDPQRTACATTTTTTTAVAPEVPLVVGKGDDPTATVDSVPPADSVLDAKQLDAEQNTAAVSELNAKDDVPGSVETGSTSKALPAAVEEERGAEKDSGREEEPMNSENNIEVISTNTANCETSMET